MIEVIAYSIICIGLIAFLVSAIGLIRMPDVYSRMHVATKSTTMGTILVILGTMLLEPTWALKLILLAIFILLTNPLSSSVIARATHKDGLILDKDELKETKQ